MQGLNRAVFRRRCCRVDGQFRTSERNEHTATMAHAGMLFSYKTMLLRGEAEVLEWAAVQAKGF